MMTTIGRIHLIVTGSAALALNYLCAQSALALPLSTKELGIDSRVACNNGFSLVSLDGWLDTEKIRRSRPRKGPSCGFAYLNIPGYIEAEEAGKFAAENHFIAAASKMTDAINYYDAPEKISEEQKSRWRMIDKKEKLDLRWLLHRAYFYRKAEEVEKAVSDLNRLLYSNQTDADTLAKVAYEFILFQKYHDAEIAIRKSILLTGDLHPAIVSYLLAFCQEKQKSGEAAKANYLEAANGFAVEGDEKACQACLEKIQKNFSFKDLKPPRENIDKMKELLKFVITSENCFDIEKLKALSDISLHTRKNGECYLSTYYPHDSQTITIGGKVPDDGPKELDMSFMVQRCCVLKSDISAFLAAKKEIVTEDRWDKEKVSVEAYEIPSGFIELRYGRYGFKPLFGLRIFSKDFVYPPKKVYIEPHEYGD